MGTAKRKLQVSVIARVHNCGCRTKSALNMTMSVKQGLLCRQKKIDVEINITEV